MRLHVSVLSFLTFTMLGHAAHAACKFEFETELVESTGTVQSVGIDGQKVETLGGWAPFTSLSASDPLRSLANSVGRLDFCWESDTKSSVITHCTANLVEGNFVLTNHHCANLKDTRYQGSDSVGLRQGDYYLAEARLVMGLDRSGFRAADGVKSYTLVLNGNKEIADSDSALLKVRGEPLNDWDATALKVATNIKPGEALTMLHHPGGIPKQVSTGVECLVHPDQDDANSKQIRHVCPTAGGSSGALIRRASDLAIVGLHNAGGYNERDPASFNRGIRISYALRRLGLDAEIVADAQKEESVVVRPKGVDPKPALDPDLKPGSDPVVPLITAAEKAYNAAKGVGTKAAFERVVKVFPGTLWAGFAEDEITKLSARAPAKPVDPCSLVSVVSGERCEVVGGKASIVRVAIAEPEYDPCRDFRGTPPKDARCVVQAGQAVWISLAPPTPKGAYGIGSGDWIGGSGSIGASGSSFREVSGGPEMVVIPSGRFEQGSPAGEAGRYDNEGPQREVRIPNPFALGRSEVTVGEWRRFVNATGHVSGNSCQTLENGTWEERSGRGWINPGFSQGDSHPVTCVNWDDAKAYIGWLNGQVSGSPYRLPSESEWEYAARAGSTSARYWGPDASHTEQCGHANGADAALVRYFSAPNVTVSGAASCDDGFVFTSPVGRFGKNPFGLHDMHGNVWEWTEDCWHDGYSGAPRNGSAWLSSSGGDCDQRVLRGGSWGSDPRGLRSASRYGDGSSNRSYSIGFRVARTLTR